MMRIIALLAAIRTEAVENYGELLSRDERLENTIVSSLEEASASLKETEPEVFVIDNALEGAFEFMKVVRKKYPRTLVILVDEDADFGMPGQADDVSTEPFKNDDLIRRIRRLIESRQQQTLRADALPPVRAFARRLRKASGLSGKQKVSVEVLQELGYDYVGFFSYNQTDPPYLSLTAQVGPDRVIKFMPTRIDKDENNVIWWVAENGESRIATPEDDITHPLVKRGIFKSAACVPVGTHLRFGVIMVCRSTPPSIDQQHVLTVELVGAQLSTALVKETQRLGG